MYSGAENGRRVGQADRPLLPLLRWAGSKKRQFRAFQAHFPKQYKCYIEPFAGSAAFFFKLRPVLARLNDLNSNVSDFYRNARRGPQGFYAEFSKFRRNKLNYYRIREQYNALPRSMEKSILFYYLNRNCFNGIFRINSDGEFNVPFSSDRVSPYLSEEQFSAAAALLKNVTIRANDFEEFCLEYTEKNDFVFLDPPYYKDGQRIFNEYNLRAFNPGDFTRLCRLLERLDRRGSQFLVSFPAGPEAERLARAWASDTLSVLRTVAGDPSKRQAQTEVLVRNYAT